MSCTPACIACVPMLWHALCVRIISEFASWLQSIVFAGDHDCKYLPLSINREHDAAERKNRARGDRVNGFYRPLINRICAACACVRLFNNDFQINFDRVHRAQRNDSADDCKQCETERQRPPLFLAVPTVAQMCANLPVAQCNASICP